MSNWGLLVAEGLVINTQSYSKNGTSKKMFYRLMNLVLKVVKRFGGNVKKDIVGMFQ